jgi:hypothetical protein
MYLELRKKHHTFYVENLIRLRQLKKMFHLSSVADPDLGSGMNIPDHIYRELGKIRIRDKHPESATLNLREIMQLKSTTDFAKTGKI